MMMQGNTFHYYPDFLTSSTLIMGCPAKDAPIFMRGGNSMEEKTACFVEKIGGVTFIVTEHSADDAKQNTDDFIENLIIKECLKLEEECA